MGTESLAVRPWFWNKKMVENAFIYYVIVL